MDQAVGVFQLAAEADGQVVVVGALPRDGAGQGEPALAVGGLDDLGQDAAGEREGLCRRQRGQPPPNRAKGKAAEA